MNNINIGVKKSYAIDENQNLSIQIAEYDRIFIKNVFISHYGNLIYFISLNLIIYAIRKRISEKVVENLNLKTTEIDTTNKLISINYSNIGRLIQLLFIIIMDISKIFLNPGSFVPKINILYKYNFFGNIVKVDCIIYKIFLSILKSTFYSYNLRIVMIRYSNIIIQQLFW